MRLLLSSLCLCISLGAFAQGNLLGRANGNVLRVQDSDRVEGSRFLFTSFEKGKIYNKVGTAIDGLLRFDASSNEVEVLKGNDNSVILTNIHYPRIYVEFYDDTKKEIMEYDLRNGFSVPGYRNDFYFQLMYASENLVIIKANEALYKDVPETDYGGQGKVAGYYHRVDKYFYSQEGRSFVEFKFGMKGLKALYPAKKDEIKAIIKQESLNVNKEKDFIALVESIQ